MIRDESMDMDMLHRVYRFSTGRFHCISVGHTCKFEVAPQIANYSKDNMMGTVFDLEATCRRSDEQLPQQSLLSLSFSSKVTYVCQKTSSWIFNAAGGSMESDLGGIGDGR